MLSSKLMLIYRIIAISILSMPTAINIYSKGDIVSSIIYVPLITLVLSGVAIFIDGQLERLLNKTGALTRLTGPTGDTYLNSRNDLAIFKSFIKENSFDGKGVPLASNTTRYKKLAS